MQGAWVQSPVSELDLDPVQPNKFFKKSENQFYWNLINSKCSTEMNSISIFSSRYLGSMTKKIQ